MEIIDLRPMSSAPVDGTPVRLLGCAGFAIASFGVWNVAKKLSEMGTIARAGFYSMMTQSK
jgi:hypothetical protein